MSIAYTDSETQPQTCPTCGRPYEPFHLQTSAILDWVEVLQANLHDLRRSVEEVLP